MGNLTSSNHPPPLNSCKPVKYTRLKIAPAIMVPHYRMVFHGENENEIECVFQFLEEKYVYLKLSKKSEAIVFDVDENNVKESNDKCFINSAGEEIYGYKVKYRYRTNDKIKNILFKKRMIGNRYEIICILAEFKLLAGLEIGPYMGTMLNGADAYLYDEFLEYYSETLLNLKFNTKKLYVKLQQIVGKVDEKMLNNFGYSVCYHEIVIKPTLGYENGSINLPISSFFNTNSELFKMTMIEDKILKEIKEIDDITNNLSNIENCLINKNFDKINIVYEETVNSIEVDKKVWFIYKFINMISDCYDYKEYVDKIIDEILEYDDVVDYKNIFYFKELAKKLNLLKMQSKSNDFGSEDEIEQFSNSYWVAEGELQKQKLKINIQDNNKNRINQLITLMSCSTPANPTLLLTYCEILMKSGKSKQALWLLSYLVGSEETSNCIRSKCCYKIGLIYYYGESYNDSIRYFNDSLSLAMKCKYYSASIVSIFNNIGCSFYLQFMYGKAVQYFQHALKYRYLCGGDYGNMVRSNLGVCYLKMGMSKEAKQEFMLIINSGEPINNALILSKIYTNLGYMNMRSKEYSKAKEDFKQAIEIEQKCLIPNGFRPSPFLHNNMAMSKFKLKEYRQALEHFVKYAHEFELLKSVEGVLVNYNIALVYKECYKNQLASFHIEKCRKLLVGLPEKMRVNYGKKLDIEAESISRCNIEEVSDESSGAVVDLLSTLSRKNG